MPELKHNFSAGRMNKSLDERLVPNGEYRDANNIQVSTSDASDAGVVQTLLGNLKKDTVVSNSSTPNTDGIYGINSTGAVCVGSITYPARDKIYYFVTDKLDATTGVERTDVLKDYILEYNTVTKKHKYVFVDIVQVKNTINTTTTVAQNSFHITGFSSNSTFNQSGIRIGMRIANDVYSTGDNIRVTDILYDTTVSKWKVIIDTAITVTATEAIRFHAEPVLEFHKDIIITGINVLDDFIFWTDGVHEPKKINILRSCSGTGGSIYLNGADSGGVDSTTSNPDNSPFEGDTPYFHTRMVVNNPTQINQYQVVTNADINEAVWVTLKNITVIKTAPSTPLELDMYRTSSLRVNTITGIENPVAAVGIADFYDEQNDAPYADETPVNVSFNSLVDFRVDDVLIFASTSAEIEETTFETQHIRAIVTQSPNQSVNDLNTGIFTVEILGANVFLTSNTEWLVRLEDKDPLFSFKFPRFSYRYKYNDGEYSTFAPWSQIAFLPDYFEYEPKKGHNLGMMNQMRGLKIKGYHPQEKAIPQDVVEIDILYKETNNTTVYNVKTIKPSDGSPLWPNLSLGSTERGELELTTNVLYSVVPSNQLIRPWDNVPRTALAQEISANRLIYGNYLQNYNIYKYPEIKFTISQDDYNSEYALPSVKSMRDYQVGVVFSDMCGRETPVLTSKNAAARLSKNASASRNRLKLKLGNTDAIPAWADYYSFYVKETSVEYYTMSMDRWYNAADGNIWLSFPSSERNKIKEQEFLILKKAHGNDQVVYEKAKYKVLAVESNAPDDIKTQRISLGKIPVDNTSSGFPLPTYGIISIGYASFASVFGSQLHINPPDGLYLKVSQGTNTSDFYQVASITQGSALNDPYTLTLSEPFGEDVAFTSTNNTAASAVAGVNLELFEFEVQNKPEFDGRFFVKIYKDGAISSYIEGSDVEQLIVSKSWDLGYINNNAYVNAGTWASRTEENNLDPEADSNGTPYPGFSGVISSDPLLGDNNTVDSYNNSLWASAENWNYTDYPYNANHPTEHDWSNIDGEGTAITGYDAGDYAEGGPYLFSEGSGALYNRVLNHPLIAINGFREYDDEETVGAIRFWHGVVWESKNFFIDACSAGSWTGRGYNHPGTHYYEGFSTQEGAQYFSWGSTPNATGVWREMDESNSGGWGAWDYLMGPFSSMNSMQAMPSRGIWSNWAGDKSFMDISWSSFSGFENAGGIGIPDTATPFAHRLSDESSGINLQAHTFISQLVNPGTKFRFSRDPDQHVYTVEAFIGSVDARTYDNPDYGWNPDANIYDGAFGIRNVNTGFESENGDGIEKANVLQHANWNKRQRWTLVVTPAIGSHADGHGYNPIHGTDPGVTTDIADTNWRRALKHDMSGAMDTIEILVPFQYDLDTFTNKPAIWETEPKESVDLDIYYQASGLIPLTLNEKTNEEYIPIGSTFDVVSSQGITTGDFSVPQGTDTTETITTHTITSWDYSTNTINFTPAIVESIVYTQDGSGNTVSSASFNSSLFINTTINFAIRDYGLITGHNVAYVAAGSTSMQLHGGIETADANHKLYSQTHKLDWNNCWCFGNGVESDRIRDDFNAPQMDNGVKASSILDVPKVKEEQRKSGLIWSGIYNSFSGVNNSNQFIAGENITKDLNPSHGSIQALKARDTRLVMFCEDKVLKAETNRDLLFNADGSSQVISKSTVVGAATAYQGDYGISRNPESLAVTPYSMYFCDVSRGKVLALSTEGVRPISDIGMKNYFADYMAKNVARAYGSYDERKNEYNLTLTKKSDLLQHLPDSRVDGQITVSYSEKSKGWVSFKSFWDSTYASNKNKLGLQGGLSLNNDYYTFSDGHIWQHHNTSVNVNNFYDTPVESDITLLFNDQSGSVKSFNTINYEGSQARVTNWDDATPGVDNVGFFTNDSTDGTGDTAGTTSVSNVTDGEYFNLGATIKGWYVDNITTNLQTCGELEFKDKEGKWFAFPTGDATSLSNLDEKEFSVQGIGLANITNADTSTAGSTMTITVENSNLASDTTNWDTTPD